MNKKPTLIHIQPTKINFDPDMPLEYYHLGNWGIPFCRQFLSRSKKYNFESWSNYFEDEYGYHGISVIEKYGVKSRLFPSNRIGGLWISLPILKYLEARISSGEKIIVHFQGLHDLMVYLVVLIFSRKVPIVCQHRVPSVPPIINFKFFRKRTIYFIKHLIDRISIKNLDYIFASSLGEYYYLSRNIKKVKLVRQKGGGFDFASYKIGDKAKLRKELNLPLDKKILIHVGRFNDRKGLKTILEVYRILNTKRSDVQLVVIGGSENEPLYKRVKESGALYRGHINKSEVIKHINASDVYVQYGNSKLRNFFEDIDNTILESLAMNVPVVSPTLIQFKGCSEERKNLGITVRPNNKKDFISSLEKILDNPSKYQDTRSIVKKYYHWDVIIKNNKLVYDFLLGSSNV